MTTKTNSYEDAKSKLKDWRWRLNHLYKIVDKSSNLIRFQENPIQKLINDCTAKRRRILKARQFGVSTNCILRLLDHAIFTPNTTVCILAHEQDSIKKLFRIVQRAHKALDARVRPDLDRGGGSKYEQYYPEINSRVYVDLESRSDTINRLHISEAAFFKDPSKIKATIEAVPLDGEVTYETTPNGMNFFYDDWTDPGEHTENLFFPWFLHPEYQIPTDKLQLTKDERKLIAYVKKAYGFTLTHEQIAFRRLKKESLKELYIQEYPEDDQTCFLASGEAAMDLVKLAGYKQAASDPVETHSGDCIKIFEPYISDEIYVCGADTAEGVGGDASAASMFHAKTRRQVATLHGDFRPIEFAHKLIEFCELYSRGGRPHPLLAVERNNHGHAVLLELGEDHEDYPNLHHAEDARPGWKTTNVTRPIMVDTFRHGVEDQTIKLLDADTIGECLTLVNNSGKIEAQSGKKDDRVMAAAIAVQMCLEYKTLDLYTDLNKKIRV